MRIKKLWLKQDSSNTPLQSATDADCTRFAQCAAHTDAIVESRSLHDSSSVSLDAVVNRVVQPSKSCCPKHAGIVGDPVGAALG